MSWWCYLELYYKDWVEVFIIGGNLLQALGQTADWFRRVLSVEPVKGNLRLSGYSACGQDGGVQLPHAYVEGMIHLLAFCLKCSSYEACG